MLCSDKTVTLIGFTIRRVTGLECFHMFDSTLTCLFPSRAKKTQNSSAHMRRWSSSTDKLAASYRQVNHDSRSHGINIGKTVCISTQENEVLRTSLLKAQTNVAILHSELDKLKNMYADQSAHHERWPLTHAHVHWRSNVWYWMMCFFTERGMIWRGWWKNTRHIPIRFSFFSKSLFYLIFCFSEMHCIV